MCSILAPNLPTNAKDTPIAPVFFPRHRRFREASVKNSDPSSSYNRYYHGRTHPYWARLNHVNSMVVWTRRRKIQCAPTRSCQCPIKTTTYVIWSWRTTTCTRNNGASGLGTHLSPTQNLLGLDTQTTHVLVGLSAARRVMRKNFVHRKREPWLPLRAFGPHERHTVEVSGHVLDSSTGDLRSIIRRFD